VSRIGRMPVAIPQGVEIRSDGEFVLVKGPKGELASRIPPGIAVEVDEKEVRFARSNDEPQQRAWHGLVRSLVANSVEGVTKGFSRELEIVGVGYKAEVKGKAVVFALGYSHPINFPIPDGIAVALDATGRKSGRRPLRSGSCACPIRTRRKGSSTPTRSSGARSERPAGSRTMNRSQARTEARRKVRTRVRRRVKGSGQRPRLAVFKSGRHIYAQVIDDASGATLAHASSLDAALKGEKKGANRETATRVGTLVAERAKGKGIARVVFDRGGYIYHGKVKALAEAARQGGLEF